MKARYQYRIYPRPTQIELLAKAFGCARVVWNDSLWIYKNAQKLGLPRPKDVDKLVILKQRKLSLERGYRKSQILFCSNHSEILKQHGITIFLV